MNKKGRLTAEESEQRRLDASEKLADLINHIMFLNDCASDLQKQRITLNFKVRFNKCGWTKRRIAAIKIGLKQIRLIHAMALGYEIKNKRVRRIILLLILGQFTVGGQAHLKDVEKEYQDFCNLWNQKS